MGVMVSRPLWITALVGVSALAIHQMKKQTASDIGDKANFIAYHLRRGQKKSQISGIKSPHVYVCAPEWVQAGITKLDTHTSNITELRVSGESGSISRFFTPWKSDQDKIISLSKFNELTRLQLLSRNEQFNVDGDIKSEMYSPGITNPAVIYSLKDLVRQTVIVGTEFTTKYGGYPYGAPVKQSVKVCICDSAALQFQRVFNTGRLVLLREHEPLPAGILDDYIYQKVVGKSRPKLEDALRDSSGRFVKFQSAVFGSVLFDTFAYRKFVAMDVILAGKALDFLAKNDPEVAAKGVHFKFLKYGTGFFAGDLRPLIEDNILAGVLDGLEDLFELNKPVHIKSVELPFYSIKGAHEQSRIDTLENKYEIKISFTQDDALKKNEESGQAVLATTNCGDPHAVLGNEMGYQSVDAAIAENLKDKGDSFSPLLNREMKFKYFKIKSKI